MAKIVVAHGVGQQLRGPETLRASWLPPMRDGIARAGHRELDNVDVAIAFYGDLFRPPTKLLRYKRKPLKRGSSVQRLSRRAESPSGQYARHYAAAQTDDIGRALLDAWLQHSAELDPSRPKRLEPESPPRRPLIIAMYTHLFGSKLFASIGGRTLFGDARQMSTYFQNEQLRAAARERLVRVITPDTRVVVGYSLGAVVAYETLCLYPNLPVRSFVTIGCPLGIRNLIFDRLEPEPKDNLGEWPDGIQSWHNVVDPGDIIALGKPLKPLFGSRVSDHWVDNGNNAHSLERYLSSSIMGGIIASGLQQ